MQTITQRADAFAKKIRPQQEPDIRTQDQKNVDFFKKYDPMAAMKSARGKVNRGR